MFKINFASVWIWAADLWYRKRPLYQLSHNNYLFEQFFNRTAWIEPDYVWRNFLIRFFIHCKGVASSSRNERGVKRNLSKNRNILAAKFWANNVKNFIRPKKVHVSKYLFSSFLCSWKFILKKIFRFSAFPARASDYEWNEIPKWHPLPPSVWPDVTLKR